MSNTVEIQKIYITTEGKRVRLEKAIKLLSDDFIEGGNSCNQTVIDLRDAASQLTESNRQLREELEKVKAEHPHSRLRKRRVEKTGWRWCGPLQA